jgi:hypothetical protein
MKLSKATPLRRGCKKRGRGHRELGCVLFREGPSRSNEGQWFEKPLRDFTRPCSGTRMLMVSG